MKTSEKPGVLSRMAASFRSADGLGVAEPHDDDAKNVRRIIRPVLVLLLVGACAALWVGCKAGAVGPVMMWAFSSFAAGGTTGFLFGIPKSGMGAKAPTPAGATTSPAPTSTAPSSCSSPTRCRRPPRSWTGTPSMSTVRPPSIASTRSRPASGTTPARRC